MKLKKMSVFVEFVLLTIVFFVASGLFRKSEEKVCFDQVLLSSDELKVV